jgi:hypothetical protein
MFTNLREGLLFYFTRCYCILKRRRGRYLTKKGIDCCWYLSTSQAGVASQLTSVETLNLLVGSLGDNSILFGQDDFDVRRSGHVRVDTTVSTVSTTTVLRSLVDDHAGDVKLIQFQTLGLIKRKTVRSLI